MTASPSAGPASPPIRPFVVIWIGQAGSLLGSQLVQFALVWWLTKTTGSATVLALASLAALLPQILIGPVAGALVDRWSRRAIMIAADAVIAVATLILAGLFWLDVATVWQIYAMLLLRATGAAFHWPAMQASTTLMVPEKHLSRVAGLNQALAGLAGIIIPPMGALALEFLPMQAILIIDVATAIPAIASLLAITIPQPAHTAEQAGSQPSLVADIREGLQFILSWRALLMLAVIGILVNMLGRAAGSLMPLLVAQHFAGGAVQFGWLQSASGMGLLLGGLILSIWGGFRRRVVTQMLALMLDGLAIIAIGLSPAEAFGLVLVVIFCSGLLEAIALGLSGAIAQAIIPPVMQGRVFALLLSATLGLAPLGLLVAGPTADRFGVQVWWVLTGVIITAMGAGALCIPAIVHIEDATGAYVRSEVEDTNRDQGDAGAGQR
jgi:DHA3 family macrolide efflux protein-like MFS transporter